MEKDFIKKPAYYAQMIKHKLLLHHSTKLTTIFSSLIDINIDNQNVLVYYYLYYRNVYGLYVFEKYRIGE